MIKEIVYKMFGLEPFPCPTCEVLQVQLEDAQRQNRYLLEKLLTKDDTSVPVEINTTDELEPLKPKFTPWRVRQAHFEQEDRAKAAILRKNQEDIAEAKKRVEPQSAAAKLQQESIDRLEKELHLKEG